jgi:hypothetical protein
MPDAVEICKLRLFLKLVSQVDRAKDLEPLPDIDFNIRAGNTLVGYATEAQFNSAAIGNLFEKDIIDEIKARIADLADCFDRFRQQQGVYGGNITTENKRDLKDKLNDLIGELDRYLAADYGIDLEDKNAFAAWQANHQPFHWFAEFYGVMNEGGFDVVIGNPPYVVNSAKKIPYELSLSRLNTLETCNLYAYVFERSTQIAKANAPISLIVQLTAISSRQMKILQDLLLGRGSLVVLPYPRRPESMFAGVEMPVVILASYPAKICSLFTTRIGRMYAQERAYCLQTHKLISHNNRLHGHRIGKLHSETEVSIINKIFSAKDSISNLVTGGDNHVVFYQEACRYWLKAQSGLPFFARNNEEIQPPHGRIFSTVNESAASFFGCLLNSSLFYWYYSLFSDCEHVNDDLVKTIKIPSRWDNCKWIELSKNLSLLLRTHSTRKTIRTKQGHVIEYEEMKASRAKALIDVIDEELGKLFCLSNIELDFIINYDIKYRMGGSDDGE